jgi:fibronectin type 3 domain-containing protein
MDLQSLESRQLLSGGPIDAQAAGTGLLGIYYNLPGGSNVAFANHFAGNIGATRVVATVNEHNGDNSPIPGKVQADDFTARFIGFLQVPANGDYDFQITSNDGQGLTIGDPDNPGTPLLDYLDDALHGDTTRVMSVDGPGTVNLLAGVMYPIQYFYFERGGGATGELDWSSSTIAKEVIPQSALFPPSAAGTTPAKPLGLTASSIGANNRFGIHLDWQDGDTSNDGDQLGFVILKSETGAAGSFRQVGISTSLSFDDAVVPGSSFFYQVEELNIANQVSAPSDTANGITAADVVSTTPGSLRGTYFNEINDPSFAGFASSVAQLTRKDLGVDFAFGGGSPDPIINNDDFSGRWTGQLIVDAASGGAGTYSIIANSDDGHRVFVDGQLVSFDPGPHAPRDALTVNPINLSVGNHDIIAEFYENTGGADMHIQWITPNSGEKVIPANHLIAKAATPTGPSLTIPTGSIGTKEIAISWTKSNSALFYYIERTDGLDSGFSNRVLVAVVDYTQTSFTDTTVAPNTDYRYRIRAVNYDGSTIGTQVLVHTPNIDPIPNTPTNLLAAGGRVGGTNLTWDYSGITQVTFEIERRTGGGTFAKVGTTPGTAHTFTDPDAGLVAGTVYDYRVRAVSAGGPSGYSNIATAKAGGAGGTGLLGTFFDNIDFTNQVLVRVDPGIDFDFGSGSPSPLVAPDTFSIIWTGFVVAEKTETYLITVTTEDGSRVTFNGNVIIDSFVDQSPTPHASAPLQLVAGQKYKIKYEFYANTGDAVARLHWSSTTTPDEFIPASFLFPPSPAEALAPTNVQAIGRKASALVTWNYPGAFDPGSFEIQRATGGGAFAAIGTAAGADRGFIDTDASLLAGVTYNYHVRAVSIDATVKSAYAGPASATLATGNNGTGLFATFYDNIDFTGPSVSRVEGPVDFDYDTGSPDPAIGVDTFSATWVGYIVPERTESYVIEGVSDDGERIFLDGALVVDSQTPTTQDSAPIPMIAGHKYAVVVRYYENTGGATFRLRWKSPSTPLEAIPREFEYPPDPTAQPDAPTNVKASSLCTQNLTVLWTDKALNETGYSIERSTSPNSGFVEVGATGSDAESFIDTTAVLANTAYFYRVRAVNTNAAAANKFSNYSAVASTFTGGQAINNLAGFPDGSSVNLVGSATVVGNRLRLTDNVNDQTGAAYLLQGEPTDKFTASFDFQEPAGNGADGFTMLFQNIGLRAIGGGGGGLGYSGIDATPGDSGDGAAIALKFDIYNNLDQTGLYLDGAMDDTGIDLRTSGIDLDGSDAGFVGQVYHVTLAYDQATTTLTQTIALASDPNAILFTNDYSVDFAAALGPSNCAYVGFTGATSGLNVRQEIAKFQFVPLGGSTKTPINVAGTAGADTIYIKDVGTDVKVWINHNPATDLADITQAIANTTEIDIVADGTDAITLDYSGGNLPGPINIDGKAGVDTLNFSGNVPGRVGDSTATGALNITGGTITVTSDVNGLDVTVNGASTVVNFSSTQHVASLTLKDTSKATLTPDGGHFIRTTGGTIAAGASLDLTNNDLIFQADAASRATVLAALANYIKKGRNNGAWTGVGGITSSTAAAQPNHLTGLPIALNDKGTGAVLYTAFGGPTNNAVTVDKNAVLVKYSWNGDADLSGKIDSDDYFQIDNGFALKLTGYRNGDFDFNGNVDSDDYFLIDNAFISQSGPLSSAPAAASAAKTASKSRHHRHHKK